MEILELNETLELRTNNLYRNGVIYTFGDEELLLREQLETVGTIEDYYHTVRLYDRIDVLAWNYYKSTVEDASKYWWVIADANKIDNPLDLSEWVGRSILIPNIKNILLKL